MRASGAEEIEVDVRNTTRARVSEAAVRRVVEGTLKAEGVRGAVQVSVLLCGEGKMRGLNQRYRGRDNVTDVLAFSQDECQGPEVRVLGDVVLCVPVARRQAKEYGHSMWAELAFLVVHGVLHLLGYGDSRPAEREEMLARQEQILRRLGVA